MIIQLQSPYGGITVSVGMSTGANEAGAKTWARVDLRDAEPSGLTLDIDHEARRIYTMGYYAAKADKGIALVVRKTPADQMPYSLDESTLKAISTLDNHSLREVLCVIAALRRRLEPTVKVLRELAVVYQATDAEVKDKLRLALKGIAG